MAKESWNKRAVPKRAAKVALHRENMPAVKQRAVTIAPLGTDMELRTALRIAIGSAALMPLLVRLHPMGLVAGIPVCAVISWAFWNGVSLCLWGRSFHPPSKYGPNTECKRSDWYLFVPHYVTLMFLLLFGCGGYADWVRGERTWTWGR